jgi:hypothetical protein
VARAESPAEALLNDVLAQAVTPPLKTARFRKTGRNYHRRHGDTIQVVNIQVSHGSSWAEKEFYINVGLAFDAICTLAGVPVLERPKEYECDSRGTRDRLEQLVPGPPASWILHADVDVSQMVTTLRGYIDRLGTELDRINGLETYRSHPWFNRFRPVQENAQILYLLGDFDAAWREVQDLATLFSDRQNANRADWWVESLRLTALESRQLR